MKKYCATLILFLCITLNAVNAQPYKLDTLFYNGTADKRINCVILGDGYLESQLGKFLDDANYTIDYIFSTTPFKEYKNYFNVFAISVPSNAEGAASDPSKLIDNYFGSTFNYGGIQRLLVPVWEYRVVEVLANTFPLYDQVMMIVNSTEYGGSGGWVSTSSMNTWATEVAIHEIGHSFGGLSDEYWAGPEYAHEAPNMTEQSRPDLIKWKNWLNDFGIGIFPYPENRSWFKPHANCKMQSLGEPFCSVCREQIIHIVHILTSPVDQYEYEMGPAAISFSLELAKPDPNTLKIRWLFNSVEFDKNKVTTSIELPDLNNGTNTVEAILYDSTELDRLSAVYITSVKWTIQSNVSSSIERTFGNRPGLVITGVNDEISRIRLSAFPNPSRNLLTVEYDLTSPSQTELSLLSSDGKKIFNVVKESQTNRNTQKIDLSAFASGLYILNFKSGSINQSLRIIKSN